MDDWGLHCYERRKSQGRRRKETLRKSLERRTSPSACPAAPSTVLSALGEQNVEPTYQDEQNQLDQAIVRAEELEQQLEESRALVQAFQSDVYAFIEESETDRQRAEEELAERMRAMATDLTKKENTIMLLETERSIHRTEATLAKKATKRLQAELELREIEIIGLKKALSRCHIPDW